MATRKRKVNSPEKSTPGFEKKHYNYGTWTKGRFSEAVTVTGCRFDLPSGPTSQT